MAGKRTGDRLELTKEEHIEAAKMAFTPALDADRRSPLLKVSEIVEVLNGARREQRLPEVGPDTVNRAILSATDDPAYGFQGRDRFRLSGCLRYG